MISEKLREEYVKKAAATLNLLKEGLSHLPDVDLQYWLGECIRIDIKPFLSDPLTENFRNRELETLRQGIMDKMQALHVEIRQERKSLEEEFAMLLKVATKRQNNVFVPMEELGAARDLSESFSIARKAYLRVKENKENEIIRFNKVHGLIHSLQFDLLTLEGLVKKEKRGGAVLQGARHG